MRTALCTIKGGPVNRSGFFWAYFSGLAVLATFLCAFGVRAGEVVELRPTMLHYEVEFHEVDKEKASVILIPALMFARESGPSNFSVHSSIGVSAGVTPDFIVRVTTSERAQDSMRSTIGYTDSLYVDSYTAIENSRPVVYLLWDRLHFREVSEGEIAHVYTRMIAALVRQIYGALPALYEIRQRSVSNEFLQLKFQQEIFRRSHLAASVALSRLIAGPLFSSMTEQEKIEIEEAQEREERVAQSWVRFEKSSKGSAKIFALPSRCELSFKPEN